MECYDLSQLSLFSDLSLNFQNGDKSPEYKAMTSHRTPKFIIADLFFDLEF